MWKQTKTPNLDPVIYQGGKILYNWLGWCFPEGELVVMQDGTLKPIQDVVVGDKVYSSDGKSVNTVVNTMNREGDTVSIRAYGAEVVATEEHPFFVAKNENPRYSGLQAKYKTPTWVDARDISKGDIIRAPHIEGEESGLTDDELRFYGFYLADGYLAVGEQIESRPDRKNHGRAYTTYRVVVSGGTKKEAFVDNLEVDLRSSRNKGLKVWNLRTKSHKELLETIKLSGIGGAEKQLLLRFSAREYKLILEGYLMGDGSETKTKVGVTYTAATISKKLAYSIAIAARTSGYYVGLRSKEQPKHGVIMGRTVSLAPMLYTLSINEHKASNSTKYFVNDEEYINVKSVDKSTRRVVYNLTTDGDHTYIINGMSVHNCLAYVQTAFGAGWSGSTAWDGWTNRTGGRHSDRNIPQGVYVPIWFDGYWQGGRYGHVAIYKDGKVWSSPYSNKPYADVIGSIAEVERIYGMKYVGWSEFVGPTRVIEFVNNNITLAQLNALFAEILERQPDQPAINYYVGKKTYDATRNDIIHSPERNQLLAKKEADRKAAEEAARKAEEARIAAEKAAAEAKAKQEREEAERLAELARLAQEEADRLAEEERKKKEEQAAKAPSWEDLAKEQKETNNLLRIIVDFIKRIFNIGG